MNIGEIIRAILIKLDTIHPTEPAGNASPLSNIGATDDDEQLSRMKQIAGLLPDNSCGEYANEPHEKYADIDSVTVDAGGGVNGPKHPSDLRGDHVSLYPNHQHGAQ